MRHITRKSGANVEKRAEHLDSLRGLAAITVFLAHLLYPLTINSNVSPALRNVSSMFSVDYINLVVLVSYSFSC